MSRLADVIHHRGIDDRSEESGGDRYPGTNEIHTQVHGQGQDKRLTRIRNICTQWACMLIPGDRFCCICTVESVQQGWLSPSFLSSTVAISLIDIIELTRLDYPEYSFP